MSARKAAGHRLAITLLVALALHLALAALIVALWAARPRQAQVLRWTYQEVELAQLAPPAPEVRAPPSAPASRAPGAARRRVRRRRARPPRRPAPSRRPARPAARPKGLSLRMRPLDLAPSPSLLDHELDAIRKARRGKGRGDTRSEAERVAGRMRRWLHEDAGRRNVTLGRVHPALYALLRRVERRFSPTAAMLPERLRHAGRELLSAYAAGIGAFNKMGSALPLDRWETGERSALAVLPETVKTMAGREAVARAGREADRRLVSEVCVALAPGAHPVLTSRRRFKLRQLDAHVDRAVQRAFVEAPMPADLPPGEACYRLSVSFGRTLPTPSLGCSFDALFAGWSCSGPAQRTFAHRVRLVAAWTRGR